ncbi:peptidylprolyl isomerase [Patescibacteria group bacterium]
MKVWKLLILLVLVIGLTGCGQQQKPEQERLSKPNDQVTTVVDQGENINKVEEVKNMAKNTANKVNLKLEGGVVEMELFPESAPKTVENFLSKAKSGYYEGLTFHRVEDWVAQGGDPLGTGTGGGEIATELSKVPFEIGSLGVARGGNIKISNDSQFFICTKDCSWLTGQYTNFGKVTKGMELVKKIKIGDKILQISD